MRTLSKVYKLLINPINEACHFLFPGGGRAGGWWNGNAHAWALVLSLDCTSFNLSVPPAHEQAAGTNPGKQMRQDHFIFVLNR